MAASRQKQTCPRLIDVRSPLNSRRETGPAILFIGDGVVRPLHHPPRCARSFGRLNRLPEIPAAAAVTERKRFHSVLSRSASSRRPNRSHTPGRRVPFALFSRPPLFHRSQRENSLRNQDRTSRNTGWRRWPRFAPPPFYFLRSVRSLGTRRILPGPCSTPEPLCLASR